jgi:hypothetical protein
VEEDERRRRRTGDESGGQRGIGQWAEKEEEVEEARRWRWKKTRGGG